MTTLFVCLQAVIIASLAGSVAGGLLWVWLRLVKRTSPMAQYYLWFLVLLICVLPFRIVWQAPSAVSPLATITVYVNETAAQPILPPLATSTSHVAWGDAVAAAWLAVAVGLYLWQVVRHLLWVRHLRRTTVATECPLLAECTRRRVAVRTGAAVSSPLLVGLFRPTLYLPHAALDETALRHVLAHETVHLHRGDLWLKQVALAVRCLCWFNPMVYAIYRRFTAWCEISCDVRAVKKTGGDTAAYLSTLLRLMCANGGGEFSTAMADDAHRVKARFAAVSAFRPHRAVTLTAVVIAVLLLTGAVCAGGVVAGREQATAPVLSLPLTDFPEVTVENTTPATDNSLHWPLRQKEATISASFGYRWGKQHAGIDIAASSGEAVLAAAGGTVISCETQNYNGGYGRMVMIDHGNGVVTLYAHLDRVAVSVGDMVEQGYTIGTVGATGVVTGPCLHFEVRQDNAAVNPLDHLVGLSLVEEGEAPVYWTEYVDETKEVAQNADS